MEGELETTGDPLQRLRDEHRDGQQVRNPGDRRGVLFADLHARAHEMRADALSTGDPDLARRALKLFDRLAPVQVPPPLGAAALLDLTPAELHPRSVV